MANVRDLPVLIAQGKLDSQLEILQEAIYHRRVLLRDSLQAEMLAALKPGDKIKLMGNIKPKYLTGLTGVVMEPDPMYFPKVKHGHVPVKLTQKHRRYGEYVTVPANVLEKI